MIYLIDGVQPYYRYLDDDPAMVSKYHSVKTAVYFAIFIFVLGNLAYPGFLLVRGVRRLFGEPRVVESDSVALPEIVVEPQNRQVLL